jgi:hypothetical protein
MYPGSARLCPEKRFSERLWIFERCLKKGFFKSVVVSYGKSILKRADCQGKSKDGCWATTK